MGNDGDSTQLPVSEVMYRGAPVVIPPPVKLESRHMTSTVLTRRKSQ
jgi:hypothetical protein